MSGDIMKDTIKTFSEIYQGMSIVSKYAFRYGTVLIITLIFCAIYFYIQSVISDYPYYHTMMYTDILYSIKECMGSVYVLPMLYETISMSSRR